MLAAKTIVETNVRCPSCGKGGYKVFRRLSLGGGGIRNLCRCEHCDESYFFDEDKWGGMVQPARQGE